MLPFGRPFDMQRLDQHYFLVKYSMLERIRNAASAMSALVRRQEVTANNLANVGTVGFRRNRVFETMLEARVGEDGIPYSSRQLSEQVDHAEGVIEFSDRKLDAAIVGDGYFVVQDERTGADLFTRSGRFSRDIEGNLVSTGGHIVQGADGPLTIPLDAEEIVISPSGHVSAGAQQIGQLRIVSFSSDATIEQLDGATFLADGEPEELEDPQIKQGYIELSNVNAMTELSDMIVTSRLFESQQRTLRSIDQSLERATRDLGAY